eukprot:1653485-Prorocentrum_lima.AAC.1
MTSSLVGSEMCIRDSISHSPTHAPVRSATDSAFHLLLHAPNLASTVAVSYTHLTLPTICSV